MKLTHRHLAKLTDAATRQALEASAGETELRVILTLRAHGERRIPIGGRHPETRLEARRQLIEAQLRVRDPAIRPTIEALVERGLVVKGGHGGHLTRSVVVDGKARDILKGIELAAVVRVQIDQSLELIRPVQVGDRP